MDETDDVVDILLSFTTAWVCTIASSALLLPESTFVKVAFAGGSINSMRTPHDGDTNDTLNERHRKLYSWLANRATDELSGGEERSIVLWIMERNEEDEEFAGDQAVYGAFVVDCVKTDRYERNTKVICQQTRDTLKALEVCCLSVDDLPRVFAVDVEVCTGREGVHSMEELGAKEQRIEHGSIQVGEWEFRCWMQRCKGA